LARLQANEILHRRNEKGELIPVEVELEAFRKYEYVEVKQKDGKIKRERKLKENGPTVMVIPLMRGEIQRMMAEAEQKKKAGETNVFETDSKKDVELLLKHLVDPKLTEDQIRDLKPDYAGAIVTAIMAVSLNQSQETMAQVSKAAIMKKANDLENSLKKK